MGIKSLVLIVVTELDIPYDPLGKLTCSFWSFWWNKVAGCSSLLELTRNKVVRLCLCRCRFQIKGLDVLFNKSMRSFGVGSLCPFRRRSIRSRNVGDMYYIDWK